jgi:hypothetical protein
MGGNRKKRGGRELSSAHPYGGGARPGMVTEKCYKLNLRTRKSYLKIYFSFYTVTALTCPEMGRQSQLLQRRKLGRDFLAGHRTENVDFWRVTLVALSVHVVALFPRYGHCVCSPCH